MTHCKHYFEILLYVTFVFMREENQKRRRKCFTSFNDYNLPSCSAFFHFHITMNKDSYCFQSNNNVFSNNLLLVFSTSVLFLKVSLNKTSNIKLRLFVFLIVYLLFFLLKQIKIPDHYEVIRTFSRYEFLTFDYIDSCEDVQTFITQLTINTYSVSKLEYKNQNSFSLLLLLLSGNISFNPGPVHQGTMQCSSEWNVFRSRDLHFIYLNINSLL